VPGVELSRDSATRPGLALNAILVPGAESANAMAEVMLLPSLVLAFFVAELTPSYVTIGLVPAVAASLWTLARVPALLLTASRLRQQPWAFAAALVRAAAVAILAIVASRTDPNGLTQSGRPLLVTFFLCLIVFTLAGGFGSVPTSVLLPSTISGERWAGFVRQRALWSIALSVVGALIAARLLGSTAVAFPGSYGRLFFVTAASLIAVSAFVAAMREQPVPRTALAATLPSPRTMRQPFHDPRYRRFLIFRVLLTATAAIDPFLFLYAVTRLSVPATTIGNFVLAGVLGWALSAPLWIWLEQRASSRSVLQGAAVLRLVAPAIALVLPQIAGVAQFRERVVDASLYGTIFGIAFFSIGAALAAQSRGNAEYLTPLAPRQLFPAYAAVTNGALTNVAFAPVLGGAFIQRSGYEAFFGVVIALGLAAVFAGGALVDLPAQSRDWTSADIPGRDVPRALPSGRT
jgi:hypothetical protein